MESDCCSAKIAATAELRNLASSVRYDGVSFSAAAETLEGALRAWMSFNLQADKPLAEGRRLASCMRAEEDLPREDIARSIASLANRLVEAPSTT